MADAKLIACSRMYNVSPQVRACWDALFTWVGEKAGVALDIIAHAAPLPLSQLWSRSDMGAVFMCGYPFSRLPADERPALLAAPVARARWSDDQPRYASHILVSQDGAVRSAADLPKAVWGWTVRDSQSGYHAPRAFLAELIDADRGELATIGPLLNPSGILQALHDGTIEAGALDAYAYELLSRHDPSAIARVRIVETTASRPCPVLVAARTLPEASVSSLAQALLSAHEFREGRTLLDALALARFERPAADGYDVLRTGAEAVDARMAPW